MQLHKLQDYLNAYTHWLSSPAAENRIHYWESQAYWRNNWDMDAPDLAEVFDKSLQNSTTKRLWNREAYAPKQMMLEFIKMEPHFIHSMFKELFNEEKEILGRVDRFVFYCDQLLTQYRQAHPKGFHLGHFHDDGYEMISLYLSFQFPELYAPYQAERQRLLLQKLGAVNVPLAGDFPRHVKVMRTLQNFINKKEDLLAAHQARLSAHHYAGESLLLAFDFGCFVVKEG
jgi:hypothetical protein